MVYLLRQIVFDDGSFSLIIRKQFKTHNMSRLTYKNAEILKKNAWASKKIMVQVLQMPQLFKSLDLGL